MTAPRPPILDRVAARGFLIFERGDYNANLVVERTSFAPGVYDDWLHLAYRVGGHWVAHQWACSSVPHPTYLEHPINPEGTATLEGGQHLRSHRIDWHPYPGHVDAAGRTDATEALVAVRPLPVRRDNDRNRLLTIAGPVVTAEGINIHAGRYSAGCVVAPQGMPECVAYLKACRAVWGNLFTVTVLDPD